MIHALITLVWCLGCVLLGAPWAMLFWAPAFYLGREIAQAEYRYIESHGGKRKDCPWWCGFVPSAWTLKGLLDFLLPLAAALAAVAGNAVLKF